MTKVHGIDHLQPEHGPIFNGKLPKSYQDAVQRIVAASGNRSNTSVLILAGNTLELVALEKEETGKKSVRVFTLESRSRDSGDAERKVSEVSKEISNDLFGQIERVWIQELLKVRYDEKPEPPTFDGAAYRFYAFEEPSPGVRALGRTLSGTARTVGTPEDEPSLHNFLEIANVISIFGKCPKAEESDWLKNLRTRLATQLKLK